MFPWCRALATSAVLVLALAAAGPPSAAGHGPCGCLDPVLTEVGANVRITRGPGLGQAGGRGWPAYKVVFNPRPADLGIAPAYLTSVYRPDAPTVTVLSRSRKDPTRRGAFRVPNTPDGLYMVLVFDGEEGGSHNTWDYLHVVDPTRREPRQRPSPTTPTRQRAPTTPAADSAPAIAAVLGAVAGATLALIGVYLVVRRRRRHD